MKYPTFYRTTAIDGICSRMFEPLFSRLSDRYHLVDPDPAHHVCPFSLVPHGTIQVITTITTADRQAGAIREVQHV